MSIRFFIFCHITTLEVSRSLMLRSLVSDHVGAKNPTNEQFFEEPNSCYLYKLNISLFRYFRYANNCEACKILAIELQDRLTETGKTHEVLEFG